MKYAILLFAGMLATGCDYVLAEQVRGSGVTITEQRPVDTFEAIEAAGAFDIEVVSQKGPTLELEGDDNLIPLVTTEIRGGTLYVKSERNLNSRKGIRVRISVPNVTKLSSSGASSFRVTNIKNEKLSVQSSGASSFEIAGETGVLDLDLSGAGKVDTEKLIASRVTIDVSGAGEASVYASQELNASVSGAASITYLGDPKTVNKRVSGIASISRKN